MKRFNSLHEEEGKLIDEVGRYYRSHQATPNTVFAVARIKQILDEKISMAQQMGNHDLENGCRREKAQVLAALRQMGF